MVTKVKFIITVATGAIIEEGEAGLDQLRINQWEYQATAANPTLVGTVIRAVALDRPGTAEVVL